MLKKQDPMYPEASEVKAAYEQGRIDQRAARKRHPLLMGFTFVIAIVGAGVLALAVANGGFGRGGQVVDQQLAEAQQQAEPIVRDAAASAGEAVRDATDR
jgi:hypothetical protein